MMESPDFPTFACTDLCPQRTASTQKMFIPLIWIIENFDHGQYFKFGAAKAVYGPDFKFHPLSKELWKLEIGSKCSSVFREENYTCLTISLRKVSECENTAVQFTIYWSAVANGENKFLKQSVTVPANVRHNKIFNIAENDFMTNYYGSRVYDMVIQIKTDNNVARQSSNIATCVIKALDFQSSLDKGKTAVLADMMSMLKLAEFTDIILQSEGKEIRAHKVMLAARSAVFKSMFQHQMSEKTSGSVDISDIPYDTLQLLVSYMYSGQLADLDVKSASELFVASDKYAVKDLHETCSLFLKRSMTVENCLEILMLADTHSNEDLKSSAVAYFSEYCNDIWQIPDWENVIAGRPNILLELLKVLAKK